MGKGIVGLHRERGEYVGRLGHILPLRRWFSRDRFVRFMGRIEAGRETFQDRDGGFKQRHGVIFAKNQHVRDYLEDIQEIPRPRMFWPRVVWEKYATSLDDLQYKKNRTNAVHCLNELILNALARGCAIRLEYIGRGKRLVFSDFARSRKSWL